MMGYSEIGIFGSVLLALAFLPQCYRILNTKKASDISLYYLLVLIVGALCLTIYGYGIRDSIIFGLNLYAFLCNTLLLCLKIYYDRRSHAGYPIGIAQKIIEKS